MELRKQTDGTPIEKEPMHEFIQQAMQRLGTSKDTTKAATGGLLSFGSKSVPRGDATELLDKLPGARELMASNRG